MIGCSYCETENASNEAFCTFCEAPLKIPRPTIKPFVNVDHVEYPFNELVRFHTYDLLLLLRLVREERSNAYNLMRIVRKASKVLEVDSETLPFAEEEYRHYTARMKVLEGILIDRMGYKPKRIDDKLLASLRAKIGN